MKSICWIFIHTWHLLLNMSTGHTFSCYKHKTKNNCFKDLGTNGLFHFLSIQGCGRQIPWGSCQRHFPRSQGLKLFFLGGKDKFSRGVILVRASQGKFSRGVLPWKLVSWGWFLASPPGVPVFPSPKMNLENCLPHPCMENNGIAQFSGTLQLIFKVGQKWL